MNMKNITRIRTEIIPKLENLRRERLNIAVGINTDNSFDALAHIKTLAQAYADLVKEVEKIES